MPCRSGHYAITISDTAESRNEDIARLVAQTCRGCALHAEAPDPEGHDIVINATPLGLNGNDPLPLEVNRLQPIMIVVDVIRVPVETPLLRHAKELGCRV
ncbi:hypothetical protein [Roseovarius sp. Pro17]|uniref:hypothetical protein n=1 Tax=Roseovarius sp. Pro17 TaxID=3108175 RepID=UPI002D78B3FF|nr:hypothetical protein [Roseovarius sp. Pro17]